MKQYRGPRNRLWQCVMAAWLPRRYAPAAPEDLIGWSQWYDVFLGDHWIGRNYIGPR